MTLDAAPHREPSLAVRGVSKTFAGTVALRSVDFDVQAGEVHALLGENGSGKSTVIKILSGYHQPDPGSEIWIAGKRLEFGSPEASYRHGCRFVHQDLGLIETSSVADNLALVAGFPCRFGTVRRADLNRSAQRDLSKLGLDLDPKRLVASLSPAERTGVAVARALQDDPSIPVRLLVLDEPTATLPDREVERLLAIVRNVASQGVGVLYVTHRLDEVFDVAQRITVLRDGQRVATVAVSQVNRSSLVTLLVGSELDEVRAASDELPPEHDAPLLIADGLRAQHLAGVSLEIRSGDVVGIAGITGSGREGLLPAIFGAQPRTAGRVSVAGIVLPPYQPARAMRAGVAYLPADRKTSGGFLELSTQENISISDLGRYWRWPKLSRRRELTETREWIDRLDIRPRMAAKMPLAVLSGGNQQKVLFAKWLRRTPRVFLLDEPTQGVDVGAKADLHLEIIRAARAGAGIAISSSDTDELAALCHRVIVLSEGRVVAHLTGTRVTAAEISRACLATEDRSHS
jgi:ribose transport system ATP-binding protein